MVTRWMLIGAALTSLDMTDNLLPDREAVCEIVDCLPALKELNIKCGPALLRLMTLPEGGHVDTVAAHAYT